MLITAKLEHRTSSLLNLKSLQCFIHKIILKVPNFVSCRSVELVFNTEFVLWSRMTQPGAKLQIFSLWHFATNPNLQQIGQIDYCI